LKLYRFSTLSLVNDWPPYQFYPKFFYNMKKVISNLLIALLGGIISVGLYKTLENPQYQSNTTNAGLQIIPTNYNTASDKTIFGSQNAYTNAKNKRVTVPTFDFTSTAATSTPTVVHIKTKKIASRGRNSFPFFGDDFWTGQQQPKQQNNSRKEPLSTGSGVIVSPDGFIVTNNHVIENADEIEVLLNDKRSYKAQLVGRDPSTDLAVLKVNAKGLSSIEYGDSDNVRVGEWVMAVGNPFSLASTVTTGIVSAKARNINILDDQLAIESFIQTDAAVNPGNSGGALVNLKGELIGINTAIATPTGVYAGYAFAVPVNIVHKVVTDIIDFGKVKRGFLGVAIRDVDAEIAENFSLPNIAGVLVQAVNKRSAAALAGIRQTDVIIQVAGLEVNSAPELQEIISRYRPNDKVPIIILRKGKLKRTTVVLQADY